MVTGRADIVAGLRRRIARGEPILLAGAGNGLVARAAAASDVDVLMTYNIAKFRLDGQSSLMGYLPYGDANALTFELAGRIIPASNGVPVVGGIGAQDPYRGADLLLDLAVAAGLSGVTNTPTVGTYDGGFRATLEAQGLGFDREVAFLGRAVERDVFTVAYGFSPADCAALAGVGVDVIATHLGTTGPAADRTAALEDAISRSDEMAAAARAINPDVLVVAHGGPLEDPQTVAAVLERSTLQGYLAGSSLERIPIDRSLRAVGSQFRELRLRTTT